MTFLNDVGRAVSNTMDTVSRKTGELVEVQKIRSQIGTLEKDIEKSYIQLGKMVYGKFQENAEIDEEMRRVCEEISKDCAAIEQYEDEIATVKGMKRCPGCKAVLPQDTAYCPKCGTKLEG